MTKRSTALFVDDEPSIVETFRRALRKEPFGIRTATSAAEGLDILSRECIDVVVSDEQMPGMSGSEFLAVVRRMHPQTIRIILTGEASLRAAIKAINDGEIYRFLMKPCKPEELALTVRQALQLKSLARNSARLLHKARTQQAVLSQLEAESPGITRVNRTADGVIVLDDVEEDVEALLREIGGEWDPAGRVQP